MATEDRWHDFAKEKPSEDMEGRNFIVSNGYSDTLSMWCGGYWENEPFMGNRLCDEVVRWKGYLTPEEEKANEATRTELKARTAYSIAMEEKDLESSGTTLVYLKSDVDAVIAQLQAENAELKKKLEDAKATAYTESVDAGMENRKLKRALWLARASEASKEANYWNCENESSYAVVDFNVHHETIVSYKAPHHRPYKWILIWENVERKCKAKAEEYK